MAIPLKFGKGGKFAIRGHNQGRVTSGGTSVAVPRAATGGTNTGNLGPSTHRPLSPEAVAAVPRSNVVQRQRYTSPIKPQGHT